MASNPLPSLLLYRYDLETLAPVSSAAAQGVQSVIEAPLSKIPVFIRPGSILPRKLRLRRSAKLMHFDPYTLVVAPLAGSASGALYLDDESTLAHETTGAYAYRSFSFQQNVLSCSAAAPLTTSTGGVSSISAAGGTASTGYEAPNTVERVMFAGQTRAPSSVTLRTAGLTAGEVVEQQLEFSFDAALQTVTVKKPDVRVVQDWSLTLNF